MRRLRRGALCGLAVLVLLGVSYDTWSHRGREAPPMQPDLRLSQVVSFGKNAGHGNLLGIQPYLVPADYASADRLHAKLAGYLDAAKAKGLVTPKTVVILPEYIGAWLVVAGEKRGVYEAKTVSQAVMRMALGNLPQFLGWYVSVKARNRPEAAVFQMKAWTMVNAYERVGGSLAREYGVTVVGGSIILPNAQMDRDGLGVEPGGPLENVSVAWGPTGAPLAITRKAFLTADEQSFAGRGAALEAPVLDTPAGKVATLICADSWYPECYQAMKRQGAGIVAVPAFLAGDGAWGKPWQGYSGHACPADTDSRDIGRLTEGQAWLKYALPGRIAASGAQAGMTVFLRGKLWDLGSDGEPLVVSRGKLYTCPPTDGATIANLWL